MPEEAIFLKEIPIKAQLLRGCLAAKLADFGAELWSRDLPQDFLP